MSSLNAYYALTSRCEVEGCGGTVHRALCRSSDRGTCANQDRHEEIMAERAFLDSFSENDDDETCCTYQGCMSESAKGLWVCEEHAPQPLPWGDDDLPF
jgi:hypothetical protein